MRRPDGTSWNNERRCGVAGSVQVSEYGVEAELNMSSNILANDPSWPELSYEAIHFRPEMTRVVVAPLSAGNAERLAGIAAADNIDSCNLVMV